MTTATSDPINIKIGQVFDTLDANQDGYVDWSDYQRLIDRHISAYRLDRNDRRVAALTATYAISWQEILRHAGSSSDRLTKDEYVAATRLASIDTSRINLIEGLPHAVFDVIDVNGDNEVSGDEFARYTQDVWGIAAPDALEAFTALDIDGDGLISRQEFIRAFREFYFSSDLHAPGSLLFGRLVGA
ncbi:MULTISPECIES: EF-hand domain-containing protein [Protofrankia]|uniref:EF hand repeat-containing protein n=1 Tax=Candidatus Protofrankia datiscae TaxID=2716812 RepID=F8AZ19_9ACTN|nr:MULTISPECIES: EF-hand domain-containing protein [Protofrankia]AEH09612.1 EF hand repeat-containing protein [Candidatus Protofrankia datiscae]